MVKSTLFKIITWVPLVFLVSVAVMLRGWIPSWILTWLLILYLIFGFKWAFFWRFISVPHDKIAVWRVPFYFFFWVGLDPEHFLCPKFKAPRPPLRMWLYPISNFLLSCLFIFVAPRLLPDENVWLMGWCAMMGMLIFIYFSMSHFLALMWQSFGIDAKHIMNMPLRAKSLSRFWHLTWNTAYHRLIYTFVYKPTHKWAGKLGSLYLAFLVSGLLHELAFSYPYGAGYGLPTSFFMIQAMGITLERSSIGRRMKLRGNTVVARMYVYLVTIPSSMLLFHPAIISGGVLPFLRTFHVFPLN